jgi:exodeoxyribonuclease-3
MSRYKIVSWNVNGFRAILKKGIDKFIEEEKPDILGLQEIKVEESQLKDLPECFTKYHAIYNSAERKGYSGVATFSNIEPKDFKLGFNIDEFDIEGRVIETIYDKFRLFNIYFPNGKKDSIRLDYKMKFFKELMIYLKILIDSGEKIVVMGDFNIAHKSIDLKRPEANSNISGFLPQERKVMDDFIDIGFIDSFRHFNKEPDNYTWWDPISRARERNVGWRIDYMMISKNLKKNLINSTIYDQVYGSDHCPIGCILKF